MALACRTNGPTLLRRSNRIHMLQMHHVPNLTKAINCKSSAFARAMKLLNEHLLVEIKADRYDRHIGFHDSNGSVVAALRYQFNFIRNIFGHLFRKCVWSEPVIKHLMVNATVNADTIKKLIYDGLNNRKELRKEGYVSFFVLNKYNVHDTI
ncbi:uncharacterized protein LOC119071815 [Bradysia coprophila]|uniref:uncharacterized protein LOC119071815 n=1 Tax=Bradysia coprophila TaxID=38358 RepID=UPI00187DA640|nr:uncharacterized protein LOC119071815 [Bradysia coprophila]